MIIIAHDVFEGCSDTDIYPIDTSKIKDARLKQDLEQAKDNAWFEPYDDDIWDEVDESGLPTRISTRRRYTDFMGRFIYPEHYDPDLPPARQRSQLAMSGTAVSRRNLPA